MALSEVTASFLKRCNASSSFSPLRRVSSLQCRAYANDAQTATNPSEDLEHTSFAADEKPVENFNPVKRSRAFAQKLPSGGVKYRSPRYYRGPFNPSQPLPPSHPHSREFRAGPFSLPRLEQTYNDTFAPDLMTLFYQHLPPGYEAPTKGERLRRWTGDSPYFKNRPLRGPRGGLNLRLLRKPITFNNVPKLERVTVHTMQKQAIDDTGYLAVAGMALQAMTGVRAQSHVIKKSDASFGLRAGQYLSLTCNLYGEDMYHFLSKVIDVVMPKIKDYKGIKGSSGDSSGNLTFGFTKEQVALFPEIEFNYDSYPTKMIPGCHITIHTSATTDRDARMLLEAIGIPFYGKLVD